MSSASLGAMPQRFVTENTMNSIILKPISLWPFDRVTRDAVNRESPRFRDSRASPKHSRGIVFHVVRRLLKFHQDDILPRVTAVEEINAQGCLERCDVTKDKAWKADKWFSPLRTDMEGALWQRRSNTKWRRNLTSKATMPCLIRCWSHYNVHRRKYIFNCRRLRWRRSRLSWATSPTSCAWCTLTGYPNLTHLTIADFFN